MSRIGKQPIKIPKNVKVESECQKITAYGPKGVLSYTLPNSLSYTIDEKLQKVFLNKTRCRLYGLSRTLIANIILGVSVGFRKTLQLNGVGFRVFLEKSILVFSVGYSHKVKVLIPPTLVVTVTSPTSITICGIQKEIVGQFAAKIRSIRIPEPYKGKGIKYNYETITLKVGKTTTK